MSRANRRRKKLGGRPRIEGVTREPNGRPLRSERKTETEKEARAVVIDARTRLHGLSESDSAQHYAGSVLGRLFLAKALTKRQFDAGSKLAEAFEAYYRLTGIPHPSARAQDVSRVRGLGSDADPSKARAAANRIMAIEQQLGMVDVQGKPITSVCKRVCILDDGTGLELAHMRKFLAAGLEALADHFGIERQEAA